MVFWALENADDATIVFFGCLLILALLVVFIGGGIHLIKERRERKREKCEHENMFHDVKVEVFIKLKKVGKS